MSSTIVDTATSVGIYAGTLGLISIAMVNPKGDKGLAHEWKALTLFGLVPAMLKLASMTGQAQLSTVILLITCAVTLVAHLGLREVSSSYKKAFKQPSQASPGEAFAAWFGVTVIYALVMIAALLMSTNKYNGASVIKPSAGPTASSAAPFGPTPMV